MAPPTILSIKQNFLNAQTRILSQPVAPSRDWRSANDAAEEARLSEKAIDDALYRLNHAIQQHSRRVYAPQATRHVAEQIDKLYWTSTSDGRDGAGESEVELREGADFTDAATIAALPPAWEDEREVTSQPAEAKRYADLTVRLQELSAQRAEVLERVQRLRRMREMIAPFEGDDNAEGNPMKSIQENLVTRDGEVEKELNKMRMLLARVGDKVARLKDEEREEARLFREVDEGSEGGDVVKAVEAEEKRKVEDLLERAFKRQKGNDGSSSEI